MSKLNTKTVKVKTSKPDYKNNPTPQELHMENVERGFVTCASSGELVDERKTRLEVIDGKRYIVISL